MDQEQEGIERVVRMGKSTAQQAVGTRQAIEESKNQPPLPAYRRVTLHKDWHRTGSRRPLSSLLPMLGMGLVIFSVWILTGNPDETATSQMLPWLGIVGGMVLVGVSFWLQRRRR